MKKIVEKKDLREFGITFGAIILVINSLRLLLKGNSNNLFLICSGLIFVFLSLFFPYFLKRVYAIWLKIAHFIGRCNTTIILLLLYYLILTPIGLIIRLFGHDPLCLKNRKNVITYWIAYSYGFNHDRMKQQF